MCCWKSLTMLLTEISQPIIMNLKLSNIQITQKLSHPYFLTAFNFYCALDISLNSLLPLHLLQFINFPLLYIFQHHFYLHYLHKALCRYFCCSHPKASHYVLSISPSLLSSDHASMTI